MNIKSRIDKLEHRRRPVTEAIKIYIGVSPDDWPGDRPASAPKLWQSFANIEDYDAWRLERDRRDGLSP